MLRNCENSESSFLPYSSLLPTESQSSPALPFLQVCRIALQQFDQPFVIFGWLMSLYLFWIMSKHWVHSFLTAALLHKVGGFSSALWFTLIWKQGIILFFSCTRARERVELTLKCLMVSLWPVLFDGVLLAIFCGPEVLHLNLYYWVLFVISCSCSRVHRGKHASTNNDWYKNFTTLDICQLNFAASVFMIFDLFIFLWVQNSWVGISQCWKFVGSTHFLVLQISLVILQVPPTRHNFILLFWKITV